MHGQEHFATQLALNPTAIRFDYHVLYTGAVITDRKYRVIYHQPLPVSVVQACYEHFSTVDGVALFATTLDNDYSLCDRVGSSTNILPEFTPCRLMTCRTTSTWVCPVDSGCSGPRGGVHLDSGAFW